MDKDHLGQQLRRHRKGCGYTAVQLAGRVGITPEFLLQIERGNKLPSLSTFILLTNALEAPADELLCSWLIAENLW